MALNAAWVMLMFWIAMFDLMSMQGKAGVNGIFYSSDMKGSYWTV